MKVIALSIFALLLSIAPMTYAKNQSQCLPHLVSAGDVTQQTVVLCARATQPGPLIFKIQTADHTNKKGRKFYQQTKVVQIDEPSIPGKVLFAGLHPELPIPTQSISQKGKNLDQANFRLRQLWYNSKGFDFVSQTIPEVNWVPFPPYAMLPKRILIFSSTLATRFTQISPHRPFQIHKQKHLKNFEESTKKYSRFNLGLTRLRSSVLQPRGLRRWTIMKSPTILQAEPIQTPMLGLNGMGKITSMKPSSTI